jgi:hypothetical protein
LRDEFENRNHRRNRRKILEAVLEFFQCIEHKEKSHLCNSNWAMAEVWSSEDFRLSIKAVYILNTESPPIHPAKRKSKSKGKQESNGNAANQTIKPMGNEIKEASKEKKTHEVGHNGGRTMLQGD